MLPAPTIIPPRSAAPVLLSIPHSGRDYPGWLVEQSSGGRAALESLEDPLVDRLAWRALAGGVGAVVACAPRAAIDSHRACSDIDPEVIDGQSALQVSPRARAGLGIVPGRTARHGRLWLQPIDRAELDRRIAAAQAPYPQAIERALDRLAIRSGGALLLDCHSMPPRRGQAEIVIGDRHGGSAARWVTDAAARIARAEGWVVALNEPYAGGHVVERHGRPAEGIHALQLEIDRRCYLAPDGRSPGPGFDRASRLIERLAAGLAEILDQAPAIAAE
jgi:N-formylglutamate amidohydrolase